MKSSITAYKDQFSQDLYKKAARLEHLVLTSILQNCSLFTLTSFEIPCARLIKNEAFVELDNVYRYSCITITEVMNYCGFIISFFARYSFYKCVTGLSAITKSIKTLCPHDYKLLLSFDATDVKNLTESM